MPVWSCPVTGEIPIARTENKWLFCKGQQESLRAQTALLVYLQSALHNKLVHSHDPRYCSKINDTVNGVS